MNSPIFIGGLERSGKTYMRMMLAAHPRLFFSRRTNLWTFYYNRYGDLNQAGNLQLCLADLTKSKHIRTLIPDSARLKRDLGTAPVSYGRLFALIHEHHAEAIGKTRWGDQTEFIEHYADDIFTAYPDAKIIHMLRDPRDRYEAMLHKSHRRGGLGVATVRWCASAMLAQRNQSKYSGRYKVIRYETMVIDPQKTLYETCEFLNEDFFPEMLHMQGEARFAGQVLDEEDESSAPLTTKYIGRYGNGLCTREVAYIQKQAGKLMSAYEYSLESIHFSWKERLRFHLLDETINSLYRLGWQIKGNTKNIKLWNTDRSLLAD
jgi:hypothetical protein